MLKNDTFLRVLARQPTDYTPIWLMRQAGRYLPEYRATRKSAGHFMALCQSAQYASEVTLQPLARFDLDAAILFSDILTIPDAMGLGLSFAEGEGPVFAHPLRHESDILKLQAPDPFDQLRYVMDAVSEIRRDLQGRVPLIGFTGSPYTLACYMVEGGSSKDFRHTKTMRFARPDLLHHLLEVLTQSVIAYLNAQIVSGAQALMIFDTWGGSLDHVGYQQFSLAYIRRIIEGLYPTYQEQRIPVIVFTKGGGLWLKDIAECGCQAVGLDWMTDLTAARQQVGDKVVLQGNLDPHVLFAPSTVVADAAREVLDRFAAGGNANDPIGGHIFNLGHGISQFTPIEQVKVLVDTVHDYSKQLVLKNRKISPNV